MPGDREARSCTFVGCQVDRSAVLLNNNTSESEILHRVKIMPTANPDLHRIVTISFRFLAAEDFDVFIIYCNARLAALDLCLKAAEVLSPRPEVDTKALDDEKRRPAVYVLKCWDYAVSLGPFATLWTSQAIMPVWTLVPRVKTFRNVPSTVVQVWLTKLNHPSNGWLADDASADQMDIAAGMLVGGPMIGFIADASTPEQVETR